MVSVPGSLVQGSGFVERFRVQGFRVLAGSFGFLVVATLHAQDWNQWRGPARTGVAAAFTVPSSWPDRPTKAWEVKVGAGHSSPVVSGGRAYQLSRLGEQEVVTAFDIASGKQVWQQRYDAAYELNTAAEAHGKGPKSTPAVDRTRLFTFGINGTLSAFDTTSGKVLWRKQYAKQFDASWPDFGVAMSPLVDGGVLFAHVGGNKSGALVALDGATGSEKWSWKGDGPAYASPVMATFGTVRQLITQSRSQVVGLAPADGTLLWRIPFTTPYDQNIVTPVIAGDLLIYSGIEQPLTAVRIAQTAGKWTVQPVWRNPDVPMYMTSPVAAGGYLFGLTHRNKGQFFAVDVKTGKTMWTTRGREAENAALVAAGDFLLATTTEGELVIARRDAGKFDVIKRYTVAESPVWSHPVPAGRGVLIKGAETLAYWTF
jgi:outer membrane protein assembly factor BamB